VLARLNNTISICIHVEKVVSPYTTLHMPHLKSLLYKLPTLATFSHV